MPTYTAFDPDHPPHPPRTVFKWAVLDRLFGRRQIQPPGPPAPAQPFDRDRFQACRDALVWLGHSSFLLRLEGRNLLLDPVLAQRLGPFRRFAPMSLSFEDLPAIDAIAVSHGHRDHLDLSTIERLTKSAEVVVPLGLGPFFASRGYRAITELAWWQSFSFADLRLTLTPARHWSRRGLFDLNRSLWGGVVVESPKLSLFFAGDTGYFEGFQAIGARFPGLDLALLPIGAYDPPWFMEAFHMNPEQALRAFADLGARRLIPMHWGTFQLTDEPISEPIERLRRAWRAGAPADSSLSIPAIGEIVAL
jgi:L-ascorbate metabolism protein UlaG (beta-lactamase superfamily)